MINTFIYLFCRTFPSHSYYLHLINFNYSKQLAHFIFLLLLTTGFFLGLILLNYLIYLLNDFNSKYSSFVVKRFDNFWNPREYIHIIMNYKINYIYTNLFYCFIYLIPSIIFFLFFRMERLGQFLDLKQSYNSFMLIPFMLKIPLICCFVLYIFIIKIFFNNITLRLYFEFKKIYLYCYQWGNILDPDHYMYRNHTEYRSYFSAYLFDNFLYFFILNFVKICSPYKLRKQIYLVYITDKNKHFITDKEYKDHLTYLLIPYIYFIKYSSYANTKIVNKILDFFDFLNRNFYSFLISISWLCLTFIFIYELLTNNFVLYKFYYCTIICLIYNQYIYLCYFLDFTSPLYTSHICLYYYKINDLMLDNLYGKSLRKFYTFMTSQTYEKFILAYLITGLNTYYAKSLEENKIDNNNEHFFYNFFLKLINRFMEFFIVKKFIELNEYFKIYQDDSNNE